MNEKTLTFSHPPDLDRPSSSLIKVTYSGPKQNNSSGSSEGSIASEDGLQKTPNDFSRNKDNFGILNIGSKNILMPRDQGLPSIIHTELPELAIKPSSSEQAISQFSNNSLPLVPTSPKTAGYTHSALNAQPRRPSRFFTITDEKAQSAFSSAEVKEKKINQSHISKSQEFLQVTPQFDISFDAEPATATYIEKKPRPSMLSMFKSQNPQKNTKDSSRGLSPSQINLIDDKVTLNMENKSRNLQPATIVRLGTRKSKLLDKISLIAARELTDESHTDSPAIIFKQVLKKVNPISLKKAEKNIRRRIWKNIRRRIMNFARAPFQVFSPEDSFSLLWSLLIPIMIIFDTFLTPFMISFYIEERYDSFVDLAAISTIFFILDIFVNFRTAFYDKGVLITDSSLITKHYLRKGFAADFIVIITDLLSLFYSDTALWYTKFFSIIRLKKLWGLITQLEDFLIMSRIWNAILKFGKLWGSILVVAHWLACLFHMMAFRRQDMEITWLQKNSLIGTPVYDRYTTAFYWSITTMVSVGYGDIVPISNAERIYTVVAMIISSAYFGYSLNTVGDIIREMSYEKDQRREKNRSVRKYMNQKNLGKNIQTRVKNYIQYMIESRMLYKHDDEEFFSLLSQNLKDEIISEVNGKILAESKLFSVNFTVKAASRLAKYMKEMFVSPEEVIFEEGDDNDHSIYFIVYGKIQIDYRSKKVKLLEKGGIFGDIGFFSGQPRNATAKSLFFTNIYSLNREVTNEQLKSLPSDFEMFHFIKDSINLYQDYTHLQLRCYSCDQLGHVARDCPEIHYIPDRDEVIKNYLSRQAVVKKKFRRNDRPQFHALSNLATLNSIARMIQEDYNDYTVSDEELSQDSLDIVLERNLILIPGGELNDMKNRKMDRKRKSARASINLVYEQVASANDIIGRRTSQLLSQNVIREEGLHDPMSLKSTSGEHIFFSIDKVENFELYFPQNNIIKIITEFEKQMFEQLLESRQGVAKALVIRNFGAMLRSNKGPHKSPLFYANLKKENIQRGRKKLDALAEKPQPIQRLGTLMKTLHDKKKKHNTIKNFNIKVFESEDESSAISKSKSKSSEDELDNLKSFGKGATLDQDEATIPKSDRLYERKQTNPSLFMTKLGSLNPKMINKTESEINKITSRTSSIGSPFPKFLQKEVEEDKEKDPTSAKRGKIKHLLAEYNATLEEDDAEESRSQRQKSRKSSRCLSQGKIDDMKKLVDKLDVEGKLFHQMVETKLSKRATAKFGF